MKPHESLPVGRARQELVALRSGLRGRHHAAGRLGGSLQRSAGSQSAGTGLSLADPGIQVRVIPYVTEAGQDGPVLAATVVPSRSSKSPLGRGRPNWHCSGHGYHLAEIGGAFISFSRRRMLWMNRSLKFSLQCLYLSKY